MSDGLHTTVTVNGSAHTLPEPTIAAALAVLDLAADTTHVAIALNDAVVRRAEWDGCTLKNGDRMEIITAVAGG